MITVIGAGLAVLGAVGYILGLAGGSSEEPVANKAGMEAGLSAAATTTSTQPLEISQLPDTVTNVLAENGYTEIVGESALVAVLPESVVKVLMSNDAVLRVAEESSGVEGEGK